MTQYLGQYRQSPDELYHYGVLGMHWHIRRFQPYPDGSVNGKFIGRGRMARKAKRSLNTNAYQVAAAQYGLKRSNDKYAKYAGKSAASKFGSLKEAKWNKKVDKEKRDIEFYSKIINEGHDAINKTVDSMKNQNFDVSFKEKNAKVLDRGRYMLGSFIAGPIGGVIASPSVRTRSYNVKDKGKNENQDATKNTSETKHEEHHAAYETDYDTDKQGKSLDTPHNRKLSGTENSPDVSPAEAAAFWQNYASQIINGQNPSEPDWYKKKRK